MKKILVVAAHPDDEILGCGGSVAMYAKTGYEIHVLILTEGVTSRESIAGIKNILHEQQALRSAAQKANDILGVASLNLENFPDNRLDSVDLLKIIKCVELYIKRIQPEIVFTHFGGDLNIDHQRVNQSVITACRPQLGCKVKTILFFEIPSCTEWQIGYKEQGFLPNWFIDISGTIHKKLEALKAYEMEMRPWPHARSIRAVEYLARWRGSTVSLAAAEAFVLGRTVNS